MTRDADLRNIDLGDVSIDATEATETMIVHARVYIKGMWRLKLGILLLGLAARVLKCRIEVEDGESPP
jgi:hypothetical protein